VGSRHHGRFGLTGGVVGFSFMCVVLHVPSFYKHDVADWSSGRSCILRISLSSSHRL
jgi:hypothetical protein